MWGPGAFWGRKDEPWPPTCCVLSVGEVELAPREEPDRQGCVSVVVWGCGSTMAGHPVKCVLPALVWDRAGNWLFGGSEGPSVGLVHELLAPQLACGSRPGCALPLPPPPHAHLGPSRLPLPILTQTISKHVAVMPIFKSSHEKGGHNCPPATGSHTPPLLSAPRVTSTGKLGVLWVRTSSGAELRRFACPLAWRAEGGVSREGSCARLVLVFWLLAGTWAGLWAGVPRLAFSMAWFPPGMEAGPWRMLPGPRQSQKEAEPQKPSSVPSIMFCLKGVRGREGGTCIAVTVRRRGS